MLRGQTDGKPDSGTCLWNQRLLWRQRLGDCWNQEFKTNQGNTARPCLQNKTKRWCCARKIRLRKKQGDRPVIPAGSAGSSRSSSAELKVSWGSNKRFYLGREGRKN